MDLGRSFLEALESISGNKLRSALTILGIVIGVAAVIAMLAVGNGAQQTITGSLSSMGTNLLFVFSGNRQENVRNAKPLTSLDVDALRDTFNAPSVKSVTPVLSRNGIDMTFGSETISAGVNGITPEYLAMRNLELAEGEPITADHDLQRASVVIIGSEVATKLFGSTEGAVGETIRIAGQPYRVIGTLKSKGGSSFGGGQDSQVYVPFSSAQARLIRRSNNEVGQIIIEVIDADSVAAATEEVTQILRDRHKITTGANDFTIMSQADMLATAQQITGILTIFLGGVAGISLLVGGIGIMNIMLVSVTERTREIGLRKAIGARKRDILLQFLTESSLLSLLGGLIGIALGWLIAVVIGRVATAMGQSFTPVVSIDAILLATIFSTAVGLFFGIYPANRAASLVPVEALRYE